MKQIGVAGVICQGISIKDDQSEPGILSLTIMPLDVEYALTLDEFEQLIDDDIDDEIVLSEDLDTFSMEWRNGDDEGVLVVKQFDNSETEYTETTIVLPQIFAAILVHAGKSVLRNAKLRLKEEKEEIDL